MEHLQKILPKIKSRIESDRIFLMLDYDGTLAPIAQRPEMARLPESTRTALRGLARIRDCRLVIISGRSLKDIQKSVRLKNVVYIGNHGLEITGPGISFKVPLPGEYRKDLTTMRNILRKRLASVKGAFVEDKGLSLSIHYRKAAKKHHSLIKNIVFDIAASRILQKKIRVTTGKKIFELRPAVKWDKGKAALWFLARQKVFTGNNILPVYIGDDVTDEDAFRALRNKGITILVGRNALSEARYFLKDTREVRKFLEKTLSIKKRRRNG